MGATVIDKGVTGDHRVVLHDVRQFLGQQFIAGPWLDLRVGFLLSITTATDEDRADLITPETIGTDPGNLAWSDRYAIGLTDSQHGVIFLGYSNTGVRPHGLTEGSSKLVSSNNALGDDGNFWRPTNGQDPRRAVVIMDGGVILERSTDGCQIHFAKSPAQITAGYATLLMLRIRRDNTRTPVFTMTAKTGASNGDVLYTSSPTESFLQTKLLEPFPSPVQTFGPVQLSQVPDVFFLYWPFHGSRLRIHAMGFLRAS